MKLKYFVIALAVVSMNAWSAKPLKIGTGKITATYYPLATDIADFCAEGLDKELSVLVSDGAIDNLLGLVNKKFHIGIVSMDAVKYYERKMPNKVNANRLKIITGLHQELGHLLIPKGYKPEGGSMWGGLMDKVGMADAKPMDISLLKNQKVGAWGGSTLGLKALSAAIGLGIQSVEIKPGAVGNIPVLIIGGQPSSAVQKYLDSGKYNLVAVDADTLSAKAPYYQKGVLNYSTKGKLVSTKTFAVRAVLMGKSARKASRNQTMSDLATCISENIEDMADDGDTNPNWESIVELEEAGQINWEYFPLND
jgi:hypothetical protein